jgi:UDP-glucose 4-epimerase
VIAVVGSDGFVGKVLADALGASRIVFRAPGQGETSIDSADRVLADSEVVVNASGFRVRPGLGAADYRRSHAEAVARLVPRLARGSLLVHLSSASVLGREPTHPLSSDPEGHPETFGCPAYAIAKREAEVVAREATAAAGVGVVVLRPAVLYGPEPDGMVGTLLDLARRGVLLRLLPSRHRHHLCSIPLLQEAVRTLAARREAIEPPLLLADPFVVTTAEIVALIRSIHRPRLLLPFPAGALGAVMRLMPRSRFPRLDLRTWGEILCILALDTVYDARETYRLLELDPGRFSRDRTWERLIRGLVEPA